MTERAREDRLLEVFARLADTLVDDFDVGDLLQMLVETCESVFDVAAAAILLDAGDGRLDLVASTSHESRTVELMVLAADEGPCLDAFHTGAAVVVPDLRDGSDWARFRQSAMDNGFTGVHALPMRLRQESIGALSLFENAGSDLLARDLNAAQALADVATIGILQDRAMRESRSVREQLQTALHSRIVIEQAKGVVAYTHDEDMDEAFRRIRRHARETRRPIGEVAREIVDRRLII
ncbi:GAF and ANTAR domain-containing protein [Labedella endophytica]|uniref:ANTAR domain-containing protein n=1 Tax=Labedella endophytica TaxID=1523160 RepID=A0A3S0VE43_9MICO|nr:GAF and ANTAR domain-containing protein [Labedella endophytica]RUQ98296.1 ANTAR domain-containing protein [Labedella endophytica]